VAPTAQSRLSRTVAAAIRAAIRLSGGNEVCFVCTLDPKGVLNSARVVARGDVASVLALPGFAARGEMLVHNHPSGLLVPSGADHDVAARLHDDGIGFGIVDNEATELYVVVEVPAPSEFVALDGARVEHDLGPEGAIAARHTRYEDRPTQRAMASEIARLYTDGGVGLLEAGTGVGKSLGYLVPALRWAASNRERTIVSTNTINLQEQLVGKDLPFLAGALTDQPVRFALLKGWHNYLCLLRLDQARASGNALFEEGLEREIDALHAWSKRTRDGSLADLPTPPRSEVWDEVAAEPDLCLRTQCPAFNDCFLFKARREAAQADVVVVNHHLLMADVAVRRASQNWGEAAVLPAYTRLVVDEGHHLEDAAAAHLGTTVSRRSLQRLFSRLERRGKGLLPALVGRLAGSRDLLSAASLDLVASRLEPAVYAARLKSSALFDVLDGLLQEGRDTVMRLTDDFAEHSVWRAGLRTELDDTIGQIVLLDEGLQLIRERFETATEVDETVVSLVNEIRAVCRRLEVAGDGLRAALDPQPGQPNVRWIEARGKERAVSVTTVPLNLAPILREDLFRRAKTAVVTSATLATPAQGARNQARRFDFLAGRLGLDDPELEPLTGIFDSPFDYRDQALLGVPTDIPAPNADPTGHFAAVGRIVVDLAGAADGGMFVLFTSHRDVRAMATELRVRGIDRRWALLVHGDESRDALLGRFRDAGRSILLGTSSFWEGVDVPGDALRALVIAKLPFKVPTEPMTAAHCDAIQARGGDAFQEYMLPHAALRLKQGFGRLIRSSTDRGVVIVADSRVVSKNYGRGLLDALPPARRVVGRWSEVIKEVSNFYGTAVIPSEREGSIVKYPEAGFGAGKVDPSLRSG
jgi:ATP-dependent DNA helicase DinG